MIRKSSIPRREMEALSAYMDNALSGKEKANFEARLAKSIPLQKCLKEYTQLKVCLNCVPIQKAPCNFTLTEETARSLKPKPILYPAFSFASLAAVLLLGVVFVGEFIFKNYSAPMDSSVPLVAMSVPQPAVEQSKDERTALKILNWGSGASGMGGGGSADLVSGKGGGGGMGMAQSSATSGNIVYSDLADLFIEEGIRNSEADAGSVEVPVEEAQLNKEAITEMAPGSSSAPIILGLREDEGGQVLAVYPEETAAEIEAETPQSIPYFSPYLKIGLAGLSIVFAILALVLYKRR